MDIDSEVEDYGFFTVKNGPACSNQLKDKQYLDTDEKKNAVVSHDGQGRNCVKSPRSDTETSEYDFVITPGLKSDSESELNDTESLHSNSAEGDVSDEAGEDDESVSLHSSSSSSANSKRGQMSGTRKRGRPKLNQLEDVVGQDSSPKESTAKKRGRPMLRKEGSTEKEPKRSIGRPIKDQGNEKLRLRRMRRANRGGSNNPVGRPVKHPTNMRCLIQRQDSRESKLVQDCLIVAKEHLSEPEAQQLLMQVSKTKHGSTSLSVFNKLSQTADQVQQAKEVLEAVKRGVKRLSKGDSLLVNRTAVSFLPASVCVNWLGLTRRQVRDLKNSNKPSLAMTTLVDDHFTMHSLRDLTEVDEEKVTITYLAKAHTILFEVKEAHKASVQSKFDIRADDEIGMLGVWNPDLKDMMDRFWPVESVDKKNFSIVLKFPLLDLVVDHEEISEPEKKILLNEVGSQVLFRRWKPGQTPVSRTSLEEREIYRNMFEEWTTSKSGMVTNTKLLLKSKEELYEKVFAHYPNFVAKLIREKPDLLEGAKSSLARTKFQNDLILVAESVGQIEPIFGSEATRLKYWQQIYKGLLAKNQLRNNQQIFAPRKRPETSEEKPLSEDQTKNIPMVSPVTEKTFWSLINNVLQIKWTSVENPTFCKICEDGPGIVQSLKKASEQMVILEGKIEELQKQVRSIPEAKNQAPVHAAIAKESAALSKERMRIRELQPKANHYELHLKQKEVNREKVHEIQRNLKPHECLVFRDFVNSYNARGKKVLNMVLVVLYVLEEGQDPPCVTVVHNVSDFEFDPNNKTDRYFAMDVLDFHLNPENGSLLFARFSIIYLSGDHGSHFSAREMIYFVSLIWERYKKTLREVSLASYHCYNRCDGGGAALVTLVKGQAKQGADLWGARDYVECIRKFGAENTVGYEFDRINRSQWLTAGYLPKVKAKRTTGGLIDDCTDEWLRRQCDIRFDYENDKGETIHLTGGIIFCREVIGEGEYKVFNLGTAHRDTFCKLCSNEPGTRLRKPVFHEGVKCPKLDIIASMSSGSLMETMNLDARPDPERIRGEQVEQTRKVWVDPSTGKPRAAKKPASFACKFPGCLKKFVAVHGVNKHMASYHAYWDDLQENLFPVEKPTRKRKTPEGNQGEGDSAEQDAKYQCKYCSRMYKSCAWANKHMQREHAQEVNQADLYVVEVKDDQTDEGGCESEVGVASCEEDIELDADDSLGEVESDAEVNESESCESGGEHQSEQDQDDEAEGNQLEGDDNELVCEGYAPRNPVQKPGVKDKVYVLYRHKGIFRIYTGNVQEKTIGKGGTPSHFERVLFDDDQESYDVQRDNIDTRKHYALLRCFISNVVRRAPSESDFQTLESELRACFGDFNGKQLQRLTVFIGNNAKDEQLAEKLKELCGRLDQKKPAPLNEYQLGRLANINDNREALSRFGFVSKDEPHVDVLVQKRGQGKPEKRPKSELGMRVRTSLRISSRTDPKIPCQQLQSGASSSSSSSSSSTSSTSSTSSSSSKEAAEHE